MNMRENINKHNQRKYGVTIVLCQQSGLGWSLTPGQTYDFNPTVSTVLQPVKVVFTA